MKVFINVTETENQSQKIEIEIYTIHGDIYYIYNFEAESFS